jgi:2-polyprenyl-3-methyl-5-hydroxy-6-metoxy-1,4-benzoquinol methylase
VPDWSCPVCGSSLSPDGDELRCEAAGHAYPVRDGIPRFVPTSGYSAAFGLQWKRHQLTQLDSHTGSPGSARRARRILGDALWEELDGRVVLECGCGAGRFTEVLLGRGAAVVSVDLSEAVEANAANFPIDERHRVAQADIRHLPLRPGRFDVVFCLGVVQHTPSPEQTIAALAAQVRPGGWLAIDHYTHNLSYYTKTEPLVRKVFLRMSPERGLRETDRLVNHLLPLHKRVRNVPIAQKLLSRVSPVRSYYHLRPDLPDEILVEFARLDTHDGLTDRYKHFRTQGQLRRAVEATGLRVEWSQRGGNGIELRARRPAHDA